MIQTAPCVEPGRARKVSAGSRTGTVATAKPAPVTAGPAAAARRRSSGVQSARAIGVLVQNNAPGDPPYWRDVGTIDAYYEAHTDLVSVHPIFNLYNQRWPIRTAMAPLPPAKFVEGGIAQDSIVGAGTIISGAIVRRSVISPNVRVEAGAEVSDSVVLPGTLAACSGLPLAPTTISRGVLISNE